MQRLVTRSNKYIFFMTLFLLVTISGAGYSQEKLSCAEENKCFFQYHSDFLSGYYFSDFDSSMYASIKFKHYYERILRAVPAEARCIEFCKTMYNYFLVNIDSLWHEYPKIPKIIHQIWLGPNPLPEKFQELSSILIQKHPGWMYKLWTEDDIKNLALINRDLYEQTPSWAEKANILRYEILFQFGGVYVDVDYECLKTFDLLHHSCDFYAGFEYVPTRYNAFLIGNAVIGARPQHLILAKVVEKIRQLWPIYQTWSRENQLERSGTRCFSRTIKDLIATCKGMNIIFPSNVFYPFTEKTFMIHPQTLGIHYWDATWLKKVT